MQKEKVEKLIMMFLSNGILSYYRGIVEVDDALPEVEQILIETLEALPENSVMDSMQNFLYFLWSSRIIIYSVHFLFEP